MAAKAELTQSEADSQQFLPVVFHGGARSQGLVPSFTASQVRSMKLDQLVPKPLPMWDADPTGGGLVAYATKLVRK